MDVEIENPMGVINSLQQRIEFLEAQLAATERMLNQSRAEPVDHSDALRRLRMFAVMPLYVGEGGRERLAQELGKNSPELVSCLDALFYLENAPVSDQAKREFAEIGNTGLCTRF